MKAKVAADEQEVPSIATRFENKVRTLRANAHAAYHSVQGGHEAALDAALEVIEAEWHAARAQRDDFAEALKSIRLYAQDRKSRVLAERALARQEREALPCAIVRTATGVSHYPFADELDG